MISNCPHCKKELQLTNEQHKKVQDAIDKLQPGQVIKMGCPHCKRPIDLKKEVEPQKQDAFDLFPDLISSAPVEEEQPPCPTPVMDNARPSQQSDLEVVAPQPPKPPDISWLTTGSLGEKVQSPDDATALILMPDGEGKSILSDALKRFDYRIEYADSLAETMDKMLSGTFAAVVLHTEFEGVPLAESRIHNFMQWLSMPKRRNIYYVLVGPELHTLYDLEAFTLSANLVINEKDMGDIHKILKKGMHDYEKLFHPFLESLQQA